MRDSSRHLSTSRHYSVARAVATVIALVLWITPSPVAAQRAGSLRVGMEHRAEVSTQPALGLQRESRSYWKTGFVIGTAIGAIGWALYAGSTGEGSFSLSDGVIAVGLGALIGGVPGSLIGSQIPRGP